MKLAIFILVLSLGAAFGQEKTPPKPPPVISDKIQKDFYKAQSQLIQAQAALDKAQADVTDKRKTFSDAVAALTKACGDGYSLEGDAAGDPACVAAPKPPVPAHVPLPKTCGPNRDEQCVPGGSPAK